jgi:hypothetical protein
VVVGFSGNFRRKKKFYCRFRDNNVPKSDHHFSVEIPLNSPQLEVELHWSVSSVFCVSWALGHSTADGMPVCTTVLLVNFGLFLILIFFFNCFALSRKPLQPSLGSTACSLTTRVSHPRFNFQGCKSAFVSFNIHRNCPP